MTSDQSNAETVQLELDRQSVELLHELALRGLHEKADIGERGSVIPLEYCEAFDEFIEQSSMVGRIGDQPENIQKAHNEYFDKLREDFYGE